MKTIKYEDIKTPSTLEEFRNNLKKYFVCYGLDRELLMVRGQKHNIKVDEITSFSDLYKWGVQMITPTISFDVNKITTDETITNMFQRDFSSVLNDEKRFPIYEMNSSDDVMKYIKTKDPKFVKMDNQILRCFFQKTLGDFSGYGSNLGWV
tara:strand:+ start:170 stop:622 length:453 start_codon:yes stop_codon:yes gene_type:complete